MKILTYLRFDSVKGGGLCLLCVNVSDESSVTSDQTVVGLLQTESIMGRQIMKRWCFSCWSDWSCLNHFLSLSDAARTSWKELDVQLKVHLMCLHIIYIIIYIFSEATTCRRSGLFRTTAACSLARRTSADIKAPFDFQGFIVIIERRDQTGSSAGLFVKNWTWIQSPSWLQTEVGAALPGSCFC